jgi:hypothetical protein
MLAERMASMSDDLPDWYIRRLMFRALQGLPAVEWPPDEPGNVHSIEAARTQRAIRMMREAAIKTRPL